MSAETRGTIVDKVIRRICDLTNAHFDASIADLFSRATLGLRARG